MELKNGKRFESKLSGLGKSVWETLINQNKEKSNKRILNHTQRNQPKAVLVYNRNDIEMTQNIFEPTVPRSLHDSVTQHPDIHKAEGCAPAKHRSHINETITNNINWDDMFDEVILRPNEEHPCATAETATQKVNHRKRNNTTNIKQWLRSNDNTMATDDTHDNKRRRRPCKALIQTELANKGGVMRYARPNAP